MNPYLADIKAIKKVAYTNQNVDDTMISSVLIRVQDILIRPILGTTFYKRLLTGINDADLTADESLLLKDYIFPVIASAVDMRILKPLSLQIRAKTAGTTRDEHITPLSNMERVEFEDQLRSDYEVYRNILVGYLKDNYTLFTEYENFICNAENVSPQPKETRTNIRFV
tara:strand:- start:958 stop:1464 length:507 start_codon:yes stop_codon:yes gene_type:complete